MNDLEKIENNINYILSDDIILSQKKELDVSEVKKISENYNINFLFKLKRNLKLLVNKIINLFLKDKINLVKSRQVSNVKKKYDTIAGSYLEDILKPNQNFIAQTKGKVFKVKGNIKNYYASCISKLIVITNSQKILDVGAGELTTYYLIKKILDKKKYSIIKPYCLDLSLKRLMIGKNFLNSIGQNIDIVQSDAQNMPFDDNSFDLVYTCHCLEQVPQIFEKCIREMLRVSKKYLILIEPSYELSNDITRKHIFKKNYIKINNKILNSLKKICIYKRYRMPLIQYVNGAEIVIITKLNK